MDLLFPNLIGRFLGASGGANRMGLVGPVPIGRSDVEMESASQIGLDWDESE